MGWLAFAVPFLMVAFVYFSPPKPKPVDDPPLISAWVLMLIAFTISALPFWPFSYFLLRPGVPKELSVFDEDF